MKSFFVLMTMVYHYSNSAPVTLNGCDFRYSLAFHRAGFTQKFSQGRGKHYVAYVCDREANCDEIFDTDQSKGYTLVWTGTRSLVVVTDDARLKLKKPSVSVATVTSSKHMPKRIVSSLALDEKKCVPKSPVMDITPEILKVYTPKG